jgi:hypothetical protein
MEVVMRELSPFGKRAARAMEPIKMVTKLTKKRSLSPDKIATLNEEFTRRDRYFSHVRMMDVEELKRELELVKSENLPWYESVVESRLFEFAPIIAPCSSPTYSPTSDCGTDPEHSDA